jgi:phosphoribosylglycinamide formyltransferase 1
VKILVASYRREPFMLRTKNAPKIAVLCSGNGSNLKAIINAIKSGKLYAEIAVVISDKKDAFALTRAKKAKIPTRVIEPGNFKNRESFDRELVSGLKAYKVQLVCLAGFMRILSKVMVQKFDGRILNIHPALLPSFPGAHAVHDAYLSGVKVTGVTVHIVDEKVDHGPILLQEALEIRKKESLEELLSRIHRIEHRLYPKAISMMLSGRVKGQD